MTTPRIRRSSWSLPLLVLLGLALIMAGAAIGHWHPPPQPIARTQLYAPVDPPSILSRSEYRLSGEPFLRSQAIIIKDRFVLNAALNDERLANLSVLQEQPDRLQWLESEMKIDFPGPEFIQISLTGDRPQELLLIVNAVRKAYLEITDDQESKKHEATLGALKKIQADWEKRSKINRERLRNLQIQNGVFDKENMTIVQKIALEELDGAQKDLVRVRSDIRQLRVEIGLKPEWREAFWPRYAVALNSLPASISTMNFILVGLLHDEFLISGFSVSPLVSQAEIDSDPIALELLKKIGKLKADIITVKANSHSEETFRKDSASLMAAVDLAQKELAKRRQEVRAQLEADFRVRSRNEKLANQPNSPRERYAAALALEKVLLEEVHRLDELTANKNRQLVDLTDIKDEIAKAEEIMNRASKKIDAMEIEKKAPPRVREFGEGTIIKPDELERNLWISAPVILVGLGILVLAFAGFRFRAPSPLHFPAAEPPPTSE